MLYTRAFSPATWTLPAHVSILSGLDPYEHGCWATLSHERAGVPVRAVPDGVPLVTEALSEAGYHCLAAVGGPFTSSRYGVLRGFDGVLEPTDTWEFPGVAGRSSG